MAKVLPNGTVISNDDEWLWNGGDWVSIGSSSQSKRPDRVQTDHAKTLGRAATPDAIASLANEVLQAITVTGSFPEARRLLSQRHGIENPPSQIQKLADLHSNGILTDDEFATKKAELLSRM